MLLNGEFTFCCLKIASVNKPHLILRPMGAQMVASKFATYTTYLLHGKMTTALVGNTALTLAVRWVDGRAICLVIQYVSLKQYICCPSILRKLLKTIPPDLQQRLLTLTGVIEEQLNSQPGPCGMCLEFYSTGLWLYCHCLC